MEFRTGVAMHLRCGAADARAPLPRMPGRYNGVRTSAAPLRPNEEATATCHQPGVWGAALPPTTKARATNAVFPALAGAEPRMSGRHYGVRASAAQRRRIATPVRNPISVEPPKQDPFHYTKGGRATLGPSAQRLRPW